MNITVYLGANEGNDPSLRKAVRELGTWIGESVTVWYTVDLNPVSWERSRRAYYRLAER